jgi:iron complex transport system ATP-binding protein
MLTLDNVICRAGGKVRLNIESLNVEAGQFTAVVGPNGAGKTTLFKAISGEQAYTGDIHFYDRPLSQWLSLERARHLAVLPQASQLSFPFTSKEVVEIGLTPLSLSAADARARVTEVMQMTHCQHLSNQFYPSLSGGERQRVQLARVLLQLSQASRGPLLLLDEPTSAQDLGQQHHLLSLVRSLCAERGFAVLAILHDLNQVLHYSDKCLLLRNGELSRMGSPSEVLSEDSIAEHWQYRPERLVRSGLGHLYF